VQNARELERAFARSATRETSRVAATQSSPRSSSDARAETSLGFAFVGVEASTNVADRRRDRDGLIANRVVAADDAVFFSDALVSEY
jgi:hypothetical protein